MDYSLIAYTVSVASAQQGVGFAKFLLKRGDLAFGNHVSFTDSAGDQSSGGIAQASAVVFPVDAVAASPVKSSSYKTVRRRLLRRKRRTRRISFTGDSEDGGDFGGFFLDGDSGGYDGPFGVGGGGSGGKGGGGGWNFGGFGMGNWDDSSSWPSWSVPAMDFVYEVICWIALSNCVHFAFKRMVRIVADGARGKLAMRLAPVC